MDRTTSSCSTLQLLGLGLELESGLGLVTSGLTILGLTQPRIRAKFIIRESVDSLCRDGADAQYMQYLSKSRITSPKIR